jgi:hypothetical protein
MLVAEAGEGEKNFFPVIFNPSPAELSSASTLAGSIILVCKREVLRLSTGDFLGIRLLGLFVGGGRGGKNNPASIDELLRSCTPCLRVAAFSEVDEESIENKGRKVVLGL